MNSQRRHDISDAVWLILKPHLPGQKGQWGGIAKDNRNFINAVLWVLRTGSPWCDLPPCYGKWGTTHQRFRRWRDNGLWERLLEILIDEPGFEWLIISPKSSDVDTDSTEIRAIQREGDHTKKDQRLCLDCHG